MGYYTVGMRVLQSIISIVYVAFLIRQFFTPDSPLMAASLHVYMATALVFAFAPLQFRNKGLLFLGRTLDLLCIGASLYLCYHYLVNAARLEVRLEMIDDILNVDLVAYVLGLLLIFEGVRRSVGFSLLGMILLVMIYAYFGSFFPGWTAFPGFDTPTMAELLTMKADGLFGITASTAVNFVFFFVMFGAIFTFTGGGGVFIDLAMIATARLKGGAAKMSLLGSALFGMVSGSAVANTTSTGVLTIPIMHRAGYTREQAAATEAIASTGGQLMPPIMGVAAFVMADMLGIPYTDIAAAGIIPGIAFYFALFVIVDLRARKLGIGNIAPQDLKYDPILPRAHLLLSPIILIAFLVIGYSAPYCAFVGSAVALLAPLLRKSTRYPITGLYHMTIDVAKQMAWLGVPLASVGIIMVIATQSNLALKFVQLVTSVGEGSLYLSLLMVILGCIVMGMGLPTVAAYIVGSIIFVPALVDMGVDRLAANFFVMYYCVLSMVTPPVALCSYAAAALAKSDSTKTGLIAFSYALVVFLVPFSFIADPTILWQGSIIHIIVAFIGMMGATFAWGVFLTGWLNVNLSLVERLLFLVISLGIVIEPTWSPVWLTMMGVLGLTLLWYWKMAPKLKKVPLSNHAQRQTE